MKAGLDRSTGDSVWGRVHRSVTRPVGWLLLGAGAALWSALGVVEWFRAGTPTLGWHRLSSSNECASTPFASAAI